MIEVEVGDSIFEFPDGTAPDVMRAALRKQFGSGEPTPKPEREPATAGPIAQMVRAFSTRVRPRRNGLRRMFPRTKRT